MFAKENAELPKGRHSVLLAYALAAGLLLWLGWPVKPLPFLLFMGLVPLLLIGRYIDQHAFKRKRLWYFLYVYLGLLVFNLGTTWWVGKSTVGGAIGMLVANALLMYLPWGLFRITQRMAGNRWGYFGLVLYWLSFEYLHLNWQLGWPWLTLGHGFAIVPQWVQWYEFTGALGGTLWIWLVNLLLYFTFFEKTATQAATPLLAALKSPHRKRLFGALFLVLVPIAAGYIRYFTYQEQGTEVEVVAIQPNIDPYTEKFQGSENFIPFGEQVDRFVQLSEAAMTPETAFVLWPETAIDYWFYEDRIRRYGLILRAQRFIEKHPGSSLVTGLVSALRFKNKEDGPPEVRYSKKRGYVAVYNTAMLINDSSRYHFYHKSKLVPGVEIMPYPQVFKVLAKVMLDLGGTSGGYGRQDTVTVFSNSQGVTGAPNICYESVFGAHTARFAAQGAQLIFIITNDAWWGNTDGHRHLLHYARLRAIETRRSIGRSANTGISAFINQRGDLSQPTEYGVQTAIRGQLHANEAITVYALHGDYIGRTAAWLMFFVFLAAVVKRRLA